MVAALTLWTGSFAHAEGASGEALTAQADPSWHSPSLTTETVTGPNGAVTTRAALLADEKWGIGDTKRVERVTDGGYALRGWGIASSFAIEAPQDRATGSCQVSQPHNERWTRVVGSGS